MVSHVVGSSRRRGSAGAGSFLAGHVCIFHRLIAPVVSHIMGSALFIPIPAVGKGKGSDDEADRGQRMSKFGFHGSGCSWLMLDR